MNLRMRKLEVAAKAAAVASDLLKCGGCGCDVPPRPSNPVALMTSSMDGHQHLVHLWPSDVFPGSGASTSWSTSTDATQGHDHPWVLNPDLTISIGESEGHSHVVDAAALALAALGR